MTERVSIGTTDSLDPGDRRLVDVSGTPVVVFNVDGEYYALENVCAHQGGPLSEGKQQGALVAEYPGPGERVRERFSPDRPVVACPWHGFEYDLETGTHIGDPTVSVDTFEVVEEDGELFVEG